MRIQPLSQKILRMIRRVPTHLSSHKKGVVLFIIILGLFYFGFVSAPFNFPVGSIVSIEEGTTLSEVAYYLGEKKVIQSPILFRGVVSMFFGGEKKVIAGDYFFKKRYSIFGVTSRVVRGMYGIEPTKITIFEGTSVEEISTLFEGKFSNFKKEEFLLLSLNDEGYLFPDTYLFLPNVKAFQVRRKMRDTFDEKIKSIKDEIARSGKKLNDIVIMASILEEEARTPKTRKIISGILWKRLEIGMPLQVDATFMYINGKNTFELTLDDLAIDSPYNTYKYKGLPIGPITNPGLDSILAALNPTPSPYLFYLSDMEGNTYYSKTFEEHKYKKRLYLSS